MGKLQLIEVENFKSYAGKQIIGPFDDFTCIIGPNGAGKSNLMDAISFVLGVQSRQLRSSHLKELIYRKDASSPRASKAHVKLIYRLSPDEVDDFDTDEISFTRTISGTGTSVYKLNGKDITYEKYESTLQKIGVLVKARNFLVFQGDVESVASKTPMELTKLLEQICGSDQLIDDYNRYLQQKNESEEKAIFSLQKKKMYLVEKKVVKEQKDEAELYQQKRDMLDQLKSQYVLMQLWKIKNSMEECQEEANDLKKELEVLKADKTHDNSIDAEKKKLAKVNKALAVSEKELMVKTKQVNATIVPRLDEVRAKLKGMEKRSIDLQKSEVSMQKDWQEQQQSIVELKSDISDLLDAEKELRDEILAEAAKAGPSMDAKKTQEYKKLREEVSARISSDQAALKTIENEVRSKQQRITRMEAQEATVSQEIDGQSKLIVEYTERAGRLTGAIADGVKERVRIEKLRDASMEHMQQYQQQSLDLNRQLDECTSKLREAGEDRRKGKHDESVNDAIAAMQRIFTGVHGRLVDLFQPMQRKYSQALQTALGKNNDAIVVSTKQVAAECIRYLKDHRIGTCIFLPLDGLLPKPIPERLRLLAPKYKLCVDLVDTEEMYKPAILYALSATLVCDTLSEAQELRFSKDEHVKVVTIKCHVITKSGAMTGGMTQKESVDRWEEKEYDTLRKKKVDIEEALIACKAAAPTRQSLVDMETQLKTLQTRIHFSEADKKVTVEKLNQLKQQKQLAEATLAELLKDVSLLRKEVGIAEQKSAELTQSMVKIENEICGAFAMSVGVANIREVEELRSTVHQAFMRKLGAIAERKAVLTAQLEYQNKRDFDGNLRIIRKQIVDMRKDMQILKDQEEVLMREEEFIRRSIKDISERIKESTVSRSKVCEALKQMQVHAQEVNSQRDATVKRLSGQEIMIERARVQLHEVLQKAHVDEIALPTLDADSDSNDMILDFTTDTSTASTASTTTTTTTTTGRASSTGAASRASTNRMSSYVFSQTDNSDVARDHRNVSKIDLSSMNKYGKKTKQQVLAIETELHNDIVSLSNELDTIQPNMHALKKYDSISDKLKECSDHLDHAKDEARDITHKFEDVKKQRQALLQKCFHHIQDSLSIIYRDLTKSSKSTIGGTAYLTLDNMVEPYLGGIRFTAMPPMKRFRDMEQLSGGEKTIAALALLFSIHSYRQAPFFVMDEVDAALDNVNVKKVCNYIRQRSGTFQCIVISLKDIFFEHADSLIGVCKDVDLLTSKVLTLNLNQYGGGNTSADSDSKGHDATDATTAGITRTSASDDDDDNGNGYGSEEATAEDRRLSPSPSPSPSDSGKKRKHTSAAAAARSRRVQQSIPEEDEGEEDE